MKPPFALVGFSLSCRSDTDGEALGLNASTVITVGEPADETYGSPADGIDGANNAAGDICDRVRLGPGLGDSDGRMDTLMEGLDGGKTELVIDGNEDGFLVGYDDGYMDG